MARSRVTVLHCPGGRVGEREQERSREQQRGVARVCWPRGVPEVLERFYELSLYNGV